MRTSAAGGCPRELLSSAVFSCLSLAAELRLATPHWLLCTFCNQANCTFCRTACLSCTKFLHAPHITATATEALPAAPPRRGRLHPGPAVRSAGGVQLPLLGLAHQLCAPRQGARQSQQPLVVWLPRPGVLRRQEVGLGHGLGTAAPGHSNSTTVLPRMQGVGAMPMRV